MTDESANGKIGEAAGAIPPSFEPTPETTEALIIRAVWNSRMRWSLLSILITCVVGFAVWVSFPDEVKVEVLRSLWPKKTPAVDITPSLEILHDSTLLDLSDWHDRSTSHKPEIAVRTRTLVLRRIRSAGKSVRFRHSTTGADIELSELSDQLQWEADTAYVIAGQSMTKAISVTVPIEQIREFDIDTLSYVLRYTDAFQGLTGQWVGFWIQQPTREVIMTVRFPSSRPAQGVRLTQVPPLQGIYMEKFTGEPDTTISEDNTIVTWRLSPPDLGYAYKLDWDW